MIPEDIADIVADLPAMGTIPEVARVMQVSPRTAARWIASGQLRAVKVGTCVRIPRRAVADYLAARGTP